jgi:hypothetical protein
VPGFLAPVSYAVPGQPLAAAVGDFDNDLTPDIATVSLTTTTSTNTGTASVLLGKGDGTFQAARNTTIDFGKTSAGPMTAAVGDFNGDGNLDLVFTDQDELFLLLGNGDGTFQKVRDIPLPNVKDGTGNPVAQLAFAVAVGDFNHDGTLDLAVTGNALVSGISTGFVNILLGRGDGTFKVGSTTAISSSGPENVAVADLNADGNLDVVTANVNNNTVSVLLGNGDGTLKAPIDTALPGAPTGLAVGDFNNDQIPDLVLAIGSSNTVDVLLGNGNGTFQAGQSFGVGVFPWTVAVGDFNGDGKLDIVTGNAGSLTGGNGNVSLLLGNGHGSFQPAVNFAVPGSGHAAVVVADFNGDGRPDVAVANAGSSNVSVLINDAMWAGTTGATSAPAMIAPATGSAAAGSRTPASAMSTPPGSAPPAVDQVFAAAAGDDQPELWDFVLWEFRKETI